MQQGNKSIRDTLDKIYGEFNCREYVHPDPLEFLYDYGSPIQREIVGFIASSLAYGRVGQILRSVTGVLEKMRPDPAEFLMTSSRQEIIKTFKGFKHRFTDGYELAALLEKIKAVLQKYNSLNSLFLAGYNPDNETVLEGIGAFLCELDSLGSSSCCSLLPGYLGKSAFKRINLFLRWMIRKDSVDPGGWTGIPASKLLVPIDTHMYEISKMLGLTVRKQADIKTVLEVSGNFRAINPGDPVKYDFALTRLGMNNLKDKYLKTLICI